MTNIQSKIRRSKLNPWRTTNPNRTAPQTSLELPLAFPPERASGLSRITKGPLAKVKTFLLGRSNQDIRHSLFLHERECTSSGGVASSCTSSGGTTSIFAPRRVLSAKPAEL
ncbi:hypothetical protein SCLCIDRAFT_1111357 [Scleroderma citrinum Foug A]|uniref:Uncharacterized protein n=1 Tax=Scleroderma citrinum Foug A TaxID=1036808 RepID=A0A0C3EI75_9AGAM|nr:hypothetical protein SCLCIDRAFT_1111357 [Scleroderma citrinum Foug A]